MDGILIINKPKGFTSHDVVAKLRGILKTRKIGHTGTLDPDATGVLPVCIGKATKLCDLLTEHDKCYRATVRLGISTDTEDLSGKILSETDPEEVRQRVSEDDLRQAVLSLTGEQMQIPPMYSAIKKNGKKLYEYARAGIEIEREARRINVYSIQILKVDLPEAEFSVSCSKGTYIRSLCRDLGDRLKVGGCLSELERTRFAQFSLEEALSLEEVEEVMRTGGSFPKGFVKLEEIFRDLQEVRACSEEGDKRLHNGNKLQREHYSPNELILDPERDDFGSGSVLFSVRDSSGTFLGLYRADSETGELTPYKMFLS